MKAPRLPLLASAIGIALSGGAQLQNALHFDGVNDEVVVANASAQIANLPGFSITCWVHPTQSANWPNMEAISGFRDNIGCDFYLLQTYGLTMEGRLRTSANQVFTIDSAALLTLNAWQFVALTYDGSTLSMYHNGALIESLPANGTISTPTGMFRIGNMPVPGSTQIFLNGQADEATLWKRGLTQAEIQCMMNHGADPQDPDLRLYYRMDQGVPGGTNTGITSLTDAAGNLNGTLTGFALTGAASNFVAGSPNDGTISATICSGESYLLNGQALNQSGTYSSAIPVAGGCDSLVTLNLTVIPVSVGVAQNGHLLISQANGAQYQWINCLTGAAIANASGQYYQASANGQYAVVVTQNGCTDTSACFTVTTAGVEEMGLPPARLWPQPVNGQLNVELAWPLRDAVLRVHDLTGRAVIERSFAIVHRAVIGTEALPAGAYLLSIGSFGERRVMRFARE
jgi:hypothetical protein